MVAHIPQTHVGKLAWYVSHFPRMRHRTWLSIATTPERSVVDRNERIVAAMLILKDGIKSKEEMYQLASLVRDENDYPILHGNKDSEENNALLRGYTAIAIAKYVDKFINHPGRLIQSSQEYISAKREVLKFIPEFSKTLREILNSVISDPVFVPRNGNTSTPYFDKFLAALYIIDKESALPIIKAFSSEDEIKRQITFI